MSTYELVRKTKIDGDFDRFVDGTYWIQAQYMYWYHYAYRPDVNLLRANGRFYLQIDGKDKVVPVRQITDVIQSRIDGEF